MATWASTQNLFKQGDPEAIREFLKLRQTLKTAFDSVDSSVSSLNPGGLGLGKSIFVQVSMSAGQTLTTGTDTLLTWDTETATPYGNSDAYGFHDNASNTDRLTVPAGLAGWYQIWCRALWANNSTGTRTLWVMDSSGATLDIGAITPTAVNARNLCSVEAVYLNAGDWVQAKANQSSGGNLAISTIYKLPVFGMRRIGS